MTWVVSDYTATNSQEMTVAKGQQVEVVEVCSSKPDFCLVRMPTRGTDHDQTAVPEGLVPLSVLKQPPAARSSPSRRPVIDQDGGKSTYYPYLSIYLIYQNETKKDISGLRNTIELYFRVPSTCANSTSTLR